MLPRPFVRTEMIANAVIALQTPACGRSRSRRRWRRLGIGKSGRSVTAADRTVEAADGGELPRAPPPPGGPIEIFSGDIRAGGAACEPMIGRARQVPSGATRVRRTMNGYGKRTGKTGAGGDSFCPAV